MAVSLAAALAGMSARLSTDHFPEAGGLIEHTDHLKEQTSHLAQADAEAYGRVLAAQRAGSGVKNALSEAADVPLAVAEAGAEVYDIAARLVENGNPNLRGDSITAALLAGAGVRAAVSLIEINLSFRGSRRNRQPARPRAEARR